MIEAVNENRSDCFGWALEEVLEERGMVRLKPDGCTHHHQNRKNLVGKGKAAEGLKELSENVASFTNIWIGKPPLDVKMAPKEQPESKSANTWTWFPSWHELTTHYLKEVGFLACLSQMFGATIFVSKLLLSYQSTYFLHTSFLQISREVSRSSQVPPK